MNYDVEVVIFLQFVYYANQIRTFFLAPMGEHLLLELGFLVI